ncbi:MAG: hypothetical protein RL216_1416 [Pseudomonadota bacterium]
MRLPARLGDRLAGQGRRRALDHLLQPPAPTYCPWRTPTPISVFSLRVSPDFPRDFRSFRVQFRQAHDLKAVGSNPAQESKNTSFSIYISLSCGRLYQILRLAIAAFVAAFENRANQARVPSGQIIQDKNTPGGRNGHRLPQEQPHMLDRQWQKQAIRFDRQTMMSFEWCSLRSTSSACPRS